MLLGKNHVLSTCSKEYYLYDVLVHEYNLYYKVVYNIKITLINKRYIIFEAVMYSSVCIYTTLHKLFLIN